MVEMLLLALPTVGLMFFFVVVARFALRLASSRRGRTQPAAAAAAVASHGEPVSLTQAIADHHELKRRHAPGPPPSLEGEHLASVR
jgi:hypothetical protein